MALIQCDECGQMISDKAVACPHCGCPINAQNVKNEESASEISTSQNYNDERNEAKKKGSKGWFYALIGLFVLTLGGAGLYLMSLRQDGSLLGDKAEGPYSSVTTGKYCLVLYDDNTGDFIAPNGGRICGFEVRDLSEPLTFNLKKTISMLGHSTDRVFISGEYFVADYSDYLHLDDQDPELAYATVTKQEVDGITVFTIDFAEGQIEKLQPKLHQIDFPEDQYTMLFYNDKSGALYGPGGKHICGIKDSYSDGNYRLSKTIQLFSVSTDELSVHNNKLFKSSSDAISDKYAHAGDISKSIADLNSVDEGDVIIYHFSSTPKQPETLTENGDGTISSSSSSSYSSSGIEESRETIRQQDSSDPYKAAGWKFVLARLKSPRSATLISYVGPDQEQTREFAEKINLPGLNVAVFSVDAQNSFGATINQVFLVFYKNTTPMHMEAAEKLKGEFHIMRSTLLINGYDEL